MNKQITRLDVLHNILNNCDINSTKLYKCIITENGTNDSSRRGFIFETLSIILLISKCLDIKYTNIMVGQLHSLKICKNINDILDCKIAQGNNPSDLTIQNDTKIIPFSIKYKNKFIPNLSGVSEIDGELINLKYEYMIGLIVRDKSLVKLHNYKNAGNQQKLHAEIINNNLLFDKKDIISGLKLFCDKYKAYSLNKFIELINTDYLQSPRELLLLKMHQQMTFLKFIKNKNQSLHLIAHKPRSGKSITLLSISKYLLDNKINKILIMTSVPATIESFILDLNKYIEFKYICYKNQNEFKTIDNNFKGIVFCSIQYLKSNSNKKTYLKNIKFDVMIIDECHMGSSTVKTDKEIINIDDIRTNIKINIFASGTSYKTKKFYKIKNVYEWDIEDEGYMKKLLIEPNNSEILEIMSKRHGIEFVECYNNKILNNDYSKYPTQVLIKHSIPNNIIDDINNYNNKHNTKYGYSCSSMFALVKKQNEFIDKFELENSADGIDILISFFECIISNNKMNKTTIMKKIEKTQEIYNSRISKKDTPKLFLMYLPTHTGNNNICQLQKTVKRFVKEYKLWSNYRIEYTNSYDDSGDCKEKYNMFIRTILDKTKKENKHGCILLLGNKGGVGITYHECDVTISLDDGHNIDNQKQRFSRALTEAIGKTIGINVDMNIQRTYLYLNEIIHKHRMITKTTNTNGAILKYLYENNIFLFNPTDINNGTIKTFEITEYYNKEAEHIINNIDDTVLLNEIVVVDEDVFMDENVVGIKIEFDDTTKQIETRLINQELEGEQKDCPKGIIISKENKEEIQIEDKKDEIQIEDKKEKQKRILKEICKRILFPLLALLSRTYNKIDFKEMLYHEDTKEIVNNILKDKKIIFTKNLYTCIIRIMENNNEIINNIREIYKQSTPDKIHNLIAKHFIPSIEERKNNAEIPTPLILVNEMLDKIPMDFWETPNKVFEPCCGKGNFVMKIFEKFYNGLSKIYPDKTKRCEIIITNCLYFADITPLNVFITTEILKCEIQSKTDDKKEYKFNSYIGDTLKIDIKKIFNVDNFDAVIGNPPYQDKQISKGKRGGGDLLWNKFVINSITILKTHGYLLFVHPPGWRKPESEKSKFKNLFELMTHTNQLLYLEIHDTKDGMKIFNAGTRYDWYLLEKSECYKITIVKGDDNVLCKLDMRAWHFLPNSNFDTIKNMLAVNDDKICEIIYSRNNYGSDKKWVKSTKTEEYKYVLIHSTPKSGIRYMYSSRNDNGHFNIPKVIFGEAGINNVIIDLNGDYGMTQGAMGIIINNISDGENIKKVLLSKEFNKIICSCMWSNFRIDWRLFTYFKHDFYKYV